MGNTLFRRLAGRCPGPRRPSGPRAQFQAASPAPAQRFPAPIATALHFAAAATAAHLLASPITPGAATRAIRRAATAIRVKDFLGHAWLPVFILGWSATAFALQTVRALMSDEIGKLYVTAAAARGISGRRLLWRYPARHALSPIVNSLGFDLNRIFNELPIVALIMTLTETGALLIDALARSNDQQLAGAIIFLLTASIVGLNFFTDILLAVLDPRIKKGIMG